jgi:hypothetical protein
LLLELGQIVEGERELRQAVEVARGQDARWPELRAVLALALSLRDRGDPEHGIAVLEPLYERFDEGHATVPLRVAGELLGRAPAAAPIMPSANIN